jgi:hypothetical protein
MLLAAMLEALAVLLLGLGTALCLRAARGRRWGPSWSPLSARLMWAFGTVLTAFAASAFYQRRHELPRLGVAVLIEAVVLTITLLVPILLHNRNVRKTQQLTPG